MELEKIQANLAAALNTEMQVDLAQPDPDYGLWVRKLWYMAELTLELPGDDVSPWVPVEQAYVCRIHGFNFVPLA